MPCLYRSDYGPPEAAFVAFVGKGFEAHAADLTGAQNRGQLEAMERQLLRGNEIQWCDQGYGWAYQKPVDYFFEAVLVAVIVPWFAARVLWPALRRWCSRATAVGIT